MTTRWRRKAAGFVKGVLAAARFLSHEPLRPGVVQKRDRLGVGDGAALDHRKRLGERDLEDLDVLVVVDAAAFSGAVRFTVRSDEAGDLFRHAPGAHISAEGVDRLPGHDPRLPRGLAD